MLDLLYVLVTVIALPFWFLMIFLPHREVTRRVANNYLIFLLLGVLYIFVLVGAVVAAMDSASRGGPGLDLRTTGGLAGLFSIPAVALAAWTHMIFLDLLAGHWVYHEAERLGAPTLLTSSALIVTLILAPLGVFVFVLWRSLIALRAGSGQQEQPV
jgi:Domain of unknown function (DUF4281)